MEEQAIYEEVVTHLDLVASMDEEDHGGSPTARRIREVLIPFCEREGGLRPNEERVAEYRAGSKQASIQAALRGQ